MVLLEVRWSRCWAWRKEPTCRQRLLELTASSLCQGNSSLVILDVPIKAFPCHYAGYTLLTGLGITAARPTARPLPETPPSSPWSPTTHLQNFCRCLALPHSLVSFLPPAPPQCLVLSLSDLCNTATALGALTRRELSKVSLGTLSVQDTDIWKLGGHGKGFRAVLNKG